MNDFFFLQKQAAYLPASAVFNAVASGDPEQLRAALKENDPFIHNGEETALSAAFEKSAAMADIVWEALTAGPRRREGEALTRYLEADRDEIARRAQTGAYLEYLDGKIAAQGIRLPERPFEAQAKPVPAA